MPDGAVDVINSAVIVIRQYACITQGAQIMKAHLRPDQSGNKMRIQTLSKTQGNDEHVDLYT
jgi:hypothetical protein